MKGFKEFCNESKITHIIVSGDNSAELYQEMLDDIKQLGVKVKHVPSDERDDISYGGKTVKVYMDKSVDMVDDLIDALAKFKFDAHEVDAFTWVISKNKMTKDQAEALLNAPDDDEPNLFVDVVWNKIKGPLSKIYGIDSDELKSMLVEDDLIEIDFSINNKSRYSAEARKYHKAPRLTLSQASKIAKVISSVAKLSKYFPGEWGTKGVTITLHDSDYAAAMDVNDYLGLPPYK